MNIDYVFCTSWDNVTGQDDGYDKRINTLEQFNGFQFLWNMIDLDRFIFYPSNLPNMVLPIDSVYKQFIKERGDGLSNYGGMWQYMGERDGIDLGDMHPNEHGSKLWAEYVYNTMKDPLNYNRNSEIHAQTDQQFYPKTNQKVNSLRQM